jgi:hypothetical protein
MWLADSAWRAVTARVLCAALLLTSFTSLVHARNDHDPDCAIPTVVAHDASAHMIGAPDPVTDDGQPLHCLACHLSRSFRPRTETAGLAEPMLVSGTRLLLDASPIAWNFPLSQPPLRSPPA